MQKSDWKKCKLKDLSSLITRGITPKYSTEGMFVLNQKCIRNGKISYVEARLHDNTTKKFNSEKYLQQGDTLVCSTGVGTLGRVGRFIENLPGITTVDSHVTIVRPRQDVFHLFLSYALIHKQHDIEALAEGTTGQTELSRAKLGELVLDVPPVEEQKRIAQILGSLDDKIELLQKQNKTLEDMAKAIFKSWFVDFDVIHAKQKGLPKADIMREYHLTDELYDLFPSDFENSSLGPIPLGWQVNPLSKIATFLNGLALQKYPAQAGEDFLPVIKIAELRNGVSSSTDKANTDLPTEYIVHNGDILFSWSGSLMVKIWSGGKGALNQHLFKVFSNDYPKWFYYLWVNHYLPMFQEIAADKATTMGHIQRKHLDQALVVAPADLTPFTQFFDTLIDKKILNNKQIQTLTELRDTLLPPLISGKIRV